MTDFLLGNGNFDDIIDMVYKCVKPHYTGDENKIYIFNSLYGILSNRDKIRLLDGLIKKTFVGGLNLYFCNIRIKNEFRNLLYFQKFLSKKNICFPQHLINKIIKYKGHCLLQNLQKYSNGTCKYICTSFHSDIISSFQLAPYAMCYIIKNGRFGNILGHDKPNEYHCKIAEYLVKKNEHKIIKYILSQNNGNITCHNKIINFGKMFYELGYRQSTKKKRFCKRKIHKGLNDEFI